MSEIQSLVAHSEGRRTYRKERVRLLLSIDR